MKKTKYRVLLEKLRDLRKINDEQNLDYEEYTKKNGEIVISFFYKKAHSENK